MLNRFLRAILGLPLVLAIGCDCTAKSLSAKSIFRAIQAEEPSGDAVFAGQSRHLDFTELNHLADVRHRGLIIDFGTAGRAKYTLGGWRTGWLADATVDGTTVTLAGAAARIYFSATGEGALTLRLRLKPIGTKTLSVFVNNKQLPQVALGSGTAFGSFDINVPKESVEAGENYVLLRFGGTAPFQGHDVSAAVDALTVFEGAAPDVSRDTARRTDDLVQEMTCNGKQRRVVAAPVPSTVSWHIQVPANGQLGFAVGSQGNVGAAAEAHVRVTPATGESEEVFSGSLEPKWQQKTASLAKWAGQVVRVDFEAKGDGQGGRVGWNAAGVYVPESKRAVPRQAKNVIVVLIDTLRSDHLKAFNPKSRVKTPALDALAKDSVVFENAQSTENWTKPSVASVLTGLYPSTHGAKTSEAKLPTGATMVSESFKEAGFKTASFIANGYVSDKFGFNQGWDSYSNYIRENKDTKAESLFTDAAAWVEKNKAERFFLYVHTIDPHVPYDPPEEFLKMYDAEEYAGVVSPRQTAALLERAKKSTPEVTFTTRDIRRLMALYDGEISYHDVHLGAFIERLKALGVYDDTVIVVTADHGEEFNDHGSFGHGHSTYQELLHVPLMVHFPKAFGGHRVATTTSTVHVTPTVLALTGTSAPDTVEGQSLVPQLAGGLASAPDVSFSDFLDDRRVIRAGRWKLVVRGTLQDWYDLERDPDEQTPLSLTKNPVALRYARAMLGQFLGSTDKHQWWAAAKVNARTELKQENADMDDATRQQLKALGYGN